MIGDRVFEYLSTLFCFLGYVSLNGPQKFFAGSEMIGRSLLKSLQFPVPASMEIIFWRHMPVIANNA
jgi:hypothetical protein